MPLRDDHTRFLLFTLLYHSNFGKGLYCDDYIFTDCAVPLYLIT